VRTIPSKPGWSISPPKTQNPTRKAFDPSTIPPAPGSTVGSRRFFDSLTPRTSRRQWQVWNRDIGIERDSTNSALAPRSR
jgi:hypothetical protein